LREYLVKKIYLSPLDPWFLSLWFSTSFSSLTYLDSISLGLVHYFSGFSLKSLIGFLFHSLHVSFLFLCLLFFN
jgi:hypothetical protein